MNKKGGVKKEKSKMVKLPTVFEGIFLRADSGTEEIPISDRVLKRLHSLARKYSREKLKLDKAVKEQTDRKTSILAVITAFEKLRGIISEIDMFILTAVPKGSVKWNRELLKESLKAAYSAYVAEELFLSITIPMGLVTEKGKIISEETLSDAITRALLRLGIPKEDLPKILKKDIGLTVDEEKLDAAVKEKRVELLPGTKEKDITIDLRVDQLINK